MGAFIATQEVYGDQDVIEHLWRFGSDLRAGLQEAARCAGAEALFSLRGPDIALEYALLDSDSVPCLKLRTLFNQEMIRHGVLMPWISPSLAHDAEALEKTTEAATAALSTVRKAVETDISNFLVGDAIRPVFRKWN